ncbi:hypothetical protein P2H89_07710 [Paraflavitalea sp. CAU 1676]|nr:hypothetical protein [Paraflavitalea sp. CAU 1676]
MQQFELQIIPTGLLSAYQFELSEDELATAFELLHDARLSTEGFSFYSAVAAVYSTK